MNSPFLSHPLRSESEVRARRAKLESDLRSEGTPEHVIATLATDDVAAKMLAHEADLVSKVANMFARTP